MYLLEQILNGVCQGMIYALMAIGYSTIVGVTGLVTFAYGEVVMIGALSRTTVLSFSAPIWCPPCWRDFSWRAWAEW